MGGKSANGTGDGICAEQTRMDAGTPPLAQRSPLSLDGRFRRCAFGLLYDALGDDKFLAEAEWVVSEVDRVLRRPRGIRIGEEPDRDGQYFHYLAMWLYALAVLGRHVARYREMGIGIVHEVHDAFLVPGRGVIWKMQEDLSAPYPGYGLGALDAFDGYVSYRMLGEEELSREIGDMRALIDEAAPDLVITQDLGLGMMLWMTHYFPEEPWARRQKTRYTDEQGDTVGCWRDTA